MITVEFLGPINKPNMELDIKNLSELATILQEDSELLEWLQSSAIALNNTIISSLDTPLCDGDKISLLPPVCGG